MKRAIYLIFLSFGFLNINLLFATSAQWEKVDKEYLDPSSIVIEKDGIFVNIDNNLLQVKNIAHDEKGIYFTKILIKKEVTWHWTCSHCDTKNSPFRKYCKNCKKRWNE